MFNHRFVPYIVGLCIVALLLVSYVGYRAYQKHVEFKAFTSNAQSFNRSAEELDDHHGHAHPHHGEGQKGVVATGSDLDRRAPSGDYVYEINGVTHYTKKPLSPEQIEIRAWVITGEMTHAVEKHLEGLAILFRDNIRQRVVTPDGTVHEVLVPREAAYQEGDAISRKELLPSFLTEDEEPLTGAALIIGEVEHPLPNEYYTIKDRAARNVYFNKFAWSIENSVPMAEVEEKVISGELDFSLSDKQQQMLADEEERMQRSKMLDDRHYLPPVSEIPPVKVSFLSEDEEDQLPGWAVKREEPFWQDALAESSSHRGTDVLDEGSVSEDTGRAARNADSPISASDLSSVAESQPQRVTDLQKQLTPAGIEAELTEGLSTNPADKVQQFIDQFGTEEGLRRLRESDPEAARQLEQGLRGEKTRSSPSSDSGQSPSAAP